MLRVKFRCWLRLVQVKRLAGLFALPSNHCHQYFVTGWVCYAEKTHGNFILPYIGVTKSPQQIMGSMVKYHLAKCRGVTPERVYHISVMPCYDKKLEASRADFYNENQETRDVDCVITSSMCEKIHPLVD